MSILKKLSVWIICIIGSIIASLLVTYNLDNILSGNYESLSFNVVRTFSIFAKSNAAMMFVLIFMLIMLIWVVVLTTINLNLQGSGNSTVKIIPGLRIPAKAGNGEFGTAEFLPKHSCKKYFGCANLSPKNDLIKWLCEHGYDDLNDTWDGEIRDEKLDLPDGGGVLVGKTTKHGNKYYYIKEDTHTLTIGATRSGKTRSVSLPSLCFQALSGESMVTLDAKGEMYLYMYPFLTRLGYEVIALDFDNPGKSIRINYLQEVIDYVNDENIPMAIEKARDIVTGMVQQSEHGEPIWTNGERSVIACAIMSVVWDNRTRPEYQNMSNVYYFIARMCKPNSQGIIPLCAYLQTLQGEFHPALLTIDIAEISPDKMRGSFYGSALTTLQVFNDPRIYGMTQYTDYDIYATSKRKRAIFLIIPDEKQTYYPLASLFLTLEYQRLKRAAKDNGNRLENRVNFNLEELGNSVKIEGFKSMMTVGGGAGIRNNLFVQSFSQLDDIYGKDIAQIIRDNCETWIYLQTDNGGTLKEISDKLGHYTIKNPSVNLSATNFSSSYGYTQRSLLLPEEIKRIKRPYQLVTSREYPTIMFAEDISLSIFNAMLGLKDKLHNINLIKKRQEARLCHDYRYEDMKFLSITDYFPDGIALEESKEDEKQSIEPGSITGLANKKQRPAMGEPTSFKDKE